MSDLGKFLVIAGCLIALGGLVVWFAERIPGLGRLPGDIYIKRDGWTFYFPLATSLIVSIVLSIVFWLIGRR